jgi:hypothetical protein
MNSQIISRAGTALLVDWRRLGAAAALQAKSSA